MGTMGQRWFVRCTVAYLVMLGAAILAACDTLDPRHRSLRMASFNTFMLPRSGGGMCLPTGACALLENGHVVAPIACTIVEPTPVPGELCEFLASPFESQQIEQGAVDLAARIRSGGYDFVVLNEVFDETARDRLIAELETEYPHILVEATSTDPVAPSGLMLFAKSHLEFVPFRANDACGRNAFPSIGWKVLVQTPLAGGGCTWNTQPGGSRCDGGTSIGPFGSFVEFGYRNSSNVIAAARAHDDGVLANKGVAFVKLRDTASGLQYGVFLTHTNAMYESMFDPDDDDRDEIRELSGFEFHEDEFRKIHEFFSCLATGDGGNHPPAIDRRLDHVFLLGDLNVDGDQSAPLDSITDDPNTPQNEAELASNKGEWTHFLGSTTFGGGFFFRELRDAWVFETPNTDAGITSLGTSPLELDERSAPGKRLDYILHRPPDAPGDIRLCNQHMSLSYNLRDYQNPSIRSGMEPGGRGPTFGDGLAGKRPAGAWSSDHLGVNANFNLLTPQCSPVSPVVAQRLHGNSQFGAHVFGHAEIGNDPATGDPDLGAATPVHVGELEEPGSLDWWRIDHEGQYLIALTKSSIAVGFAVAVYHHSDLSRPKQSYRDEEFTLVGVADGEDVVGKKFVMQDPPYFIQIFQEDPSGTGHYQIAVRRLTCTDKFAMACMLLPNQDNGSFTFPSGVPIQLSSPSPDSFYFGIDVQTPTDGEEVQSLRTVVHSYDRNILGTWLVGPHVDDELFAYENSIDAEYPLRNTYDSEREPMNSFRISPEPSWPDCPQGVGATGSPDFPMCNNVIHWSWVEAPNNPKGRRLFVRITRVDSVGTPSVTTGGSLLPITFSPTWLSGLTATPAAGSAPEALIPRDHRIRSIDQQELSERDEIRMRARAGDRWVGGYAPGNWSLPGLGGDCAEFDAFWISRMDPDDDAVDFVDLSASLTQPALAPDVLPYKFVSGLRVEVVEEDGCPSGGNEPGDDAEVGAVTFQGLGLFQGFGPGAAPVRRERETQLSGSGRYRVEVNLNHGTQEWEEPFDAGDLTNGCLAQAACQLQASPPYSPSLGPVLAIDDVDFPTSLYMSDSVANPSWTLSFVDDRFISSVSVLAPDGLEPTGPTTVGVSDDGVTFVEYEIANWPPAAGHQSFVFGVPARIVRVQLGITGHLAIRDVQVFGY